MNNVERVVEAFADGEEVDPVELDQALAAAEGRAHLIDVLAIRGLVQSTTRWVPAKRSAGRAAMGRFGRWSAVALLVLASALAGYLIGAHGLV